jgi:tRNA pseudouridine55 synthase
MPHGWVVLDKPENLSSAAAVARVRRLFAAAKAGHGGTLDPLATGLLPIALGEATKTVDAVMAGEKTYRFTVAWGAETATGDREGVVTATSPVRPDRSAIADALQQFIGIIEQTPPAYSALKVGGRPAYELARAGETVTLAPRRVTVASLELGDVEADAATFEVRCGKGLYVRSLARDLARALDTCGHVVMLRRTAVGPFGATDMIPLAKLEELGHKGAGREAIFAALHPLRTALDDIPALALGEAEAKRLRQGQSVSLRSPVATPDHDTVLVLNGDIPIALASVRSGVISPKRVFNLEAALPLEKETSRCR